MNKLVLLALVCAASASSAFATDYYVDVVHGDDADSGLSPATAWRTITHATLASPASAATTIRIAPGTYSTATGEVFPLLFTEQVVLSDAGSAVTIVDGGGTGTLVRMYRAPGSPIHAATSITGLTFTNAGTGLEIRSSWLSIYTRLEDVVVTNMTAFGVDSNGGGGFKGSGANIHVTVERSRFVDCGTGVLFTSTSGGNTFDVRDSELRTCAGDGFRIHAGFTSGAWATFERCRIVRNLGHGISAFGSLFGGSRVDLRDCLVAHNGDGYFVESGNAAAVASFTRCTVADNTGFGVRAIASPSYPDDTEVAFDGTIVHGNATDLAATEITSNVFSRIGGSDPLFVDRANDDYRLRFPSPCVEAGNPATPIGTRDLAGTPRSVDGNLDTIETADIGCFEFQPLGLATSGRIGTPLRLEFWGQAGSTSIGYFSRLAPVAPSDTPFGQFDLDPSLFGVLIPSIGAAPDAPVVYQRPIPPNPALIGRTISLQALTTSSLAPQGAAYTNVVSFTITP